MRPKRERAQSIMEYFVLFGVLTIIAGVTLAAAGSGQLQNALKGYLGGG